MKCSACGASMSPVGTDFPFKISSRTIVIIRDVPATSATRVQSTCSLTT